MVHLISRHSFPTLFSSGSAYICNFREHWFTIRKLGFQWFDLNSLLTAAALITDTYLSMFLAQLQTEGYSIYIVSGSLPDCPADQVLKVTPAVQTERPPLMSAQEVRGETGGSRAAAAAAAEGAVGGARPRRGQEASAIDEDAALQHALSLSMASYNEG